LWHHRPTNYTTTRNSPEIATSSLLSLTANKSSEIYITKYFKMVDLNARFPAIGMVCITTGALVLAILGGTNCEFLEVNAQPGTFLLQVDGVELEQDQAYVGVYCKNDIFDNYDDQMWQLSQIFFIISAMIGVIATALAWALATYFLPTKKSWRMLSACSSFAALFGVPVFLLFEAKPCTEFNFQQDCAFSTGSFIQIISVIAWMLGVAVTQCLDPPAWGEEPWKIGDEIDVNPTESIQGDEEQGQGELYAAPRGLQNRNTPSDEAKYSESVWDSDPFAELAEESKLRDSPTRSPGNVLLTGLKKTDDHNFHGQSRITVISSPEGGSEIVATYPAYQEESLRPRSPFKAKTPPAESPEKVRPSPFKEVSAPPAAAKNPVPSTPPAEYASSKNLEEAVLANQSTNEDWSPYVSPQKKNKKRLSNLANKLKVDVRRPTFGRISTGRISTGRIATGYSQMLTDDMSRSSKGSFLNSPPIQIDVDKSVKSEESSVRSIRVKTKAEKDHEKQLLADWNVLHAHISESQETDNRSSLQGANNEKQQLFDWNALHAATMSGARMGLQEGMSGAEDPYELASYHSDPEPVIYSSDEEDDIINLSPSQHRGVPTSIDRDDSSTISSHSSASAARKNSRSRHVGRHRRRQRSDLVSLASASLLSQTIDEETVADILEETGEEELLNTYAFARTISAPEPRSSGIDVRFSRRGRQPISHDVASVRTTNPTNAGNTSHAWKGPLDLGNAVAPDDQTAPRENATEKRQYLRTSQSGAVDLVASSTTRSLIRHTQSIHDRDSNSRHSPRTPSLSARRFNSRSRTSGGDDSSSSNSSSSMLSRRERIRALRIRRLQNQSLNTTNDQSDLDASYMPKKYDSPAKPNGHTFKEEKKEDDLPFDQTMSHVVTPDSKTNSFFLKQDSSEGDVEIKDATFDEDDLNEDHFNVAEEKMDIVTNVVTHSPVVIKDFTFKEDDVSIVTPHYNIEDSDSDGDSRHSDYVKAGANLVSEKILARFSFSDDQQSHASISAASTDNSEKYGSSLMDELDLQLIEVRRPNGVEYGNEEASL
jgi:hypothetical protein